MPRSFGPRRFRRPIRYRRRTLSSRNVFLNTGAKSQAKQIAALNRKVHKIARASKPEKKVITESPQQATFSSRAGGDVHLVFTVPEIINGSGDKYRIGDKIFRRDTWNMSFEYYNNSSTGYHESESSGVQVRIICGQWRTPHNNLNTPTVDQVIDHYDTSGSGYTTAAVAPLLNGITEQCRIFSDRVYYLTSARNQKVIKTKTPWYSNRFDADGQNNHAFVIVVVAGLHYDSNFSEYVELSHIKKSVFTDA